MSLKQIFGQYVGQHVPMVEHGPEPQGHWDKGDYHGYQPPSLANIPDPQSKPIILTCNAQQGCCQ